MGHNLKTQGYSDIALYLIIAPSTSLLGKILAMWLSSLSMRVASSDSFITAVPRATIVHLS